MDGERVWEAAWGKDWGFWRAPEAHWKGLPGSHGKIHDAPELSLKLWSSVPSTGVLVHACESGWCCVGKGDTRVWLKQQMSEVAADEIAWSLEVAFGGKPLSYPLNPPPRVSPQAEAHLLALNQVIKAGGVTRVQTE